MVRSVQLVAVCVVVACSVGQAGEGKEWKVIATAQDSQRECDIGPVRLNAYGGVVIRSGEELVARSGKPAAAKDPATQNAMTVELAKLLDIDSIDWSKQMVLAVRGEPGTKADRVHFESLTVDGKVLTVAWTVKQRPPHAGLGTPIAVLLVERFDGEVKFVP